MPLKANFFVRASFLFNIITPNGALTQVKCVMQLREVD